MLLSVSGILGKALIIRSKRVLRVGQSIQMQPESHTMLLSSAFQLHKKASGVRDRDSSFDMGSARLIASSASSSSLQGRMSVWMSGSSRKINKIHENSALSTSVHRHSSFHSSTSLPFSFICLRYTSCSSNVYRMSFDRSCTMGRLVSSFVATSSFFQTDSAT